MPGYDDMLSKGSGLMPWRWAEERLTEARNYWLTTTRSDGRPHSMPVWGVWHDGAFYFSTGPSSRKARNLAANPNCVVCPESADKALILEGVAAVVADALVLRPVLEAYERKYNWEMDPDSGPYYVVRPKVVFAFIELARETDGSPTRWTFES